MALPSWLDPVYDAAQMREADRWAIEEQGIPSLALMETAGARLAHEAGGLARPGPVRIICGKGNNGGDGLVAARRLHDAGYEVKVLLLWPEDQLSADAKTNLDRYRGPWRQVDGDRLAESLSGSGLVIDAIFGTGFSGSPDEPIDAAIEAINACECAVVACDISSGVDGSSGEVAGVATDADLTVSFHIAKVGHLVAPGKHHSGELRVVDIGIPPEAPVDASCGSIGPGVLAGIPPRSATSTKFSSGKVVLVGGSRGLTGAICLAARAASRAGAGYTQVVVPRALEAIFEVKLTEEMSIGTEAREGTLEPSAATDVIEACAGAGAVVFGSGLGRTEWAFELARAVIGAIDAPLVLDADGLRSLEGDLEILRGRERPTVLTPHAGEMASLTGTGSDQISAARFSAARELASKSRSVVVLKGDDTIVAGDRVVAVNRLASPGLATAGTGDVLAGTIAALIARGTDPFEASAAAVLAHARAGCTAAERIGAAESVNAGDVIDALPAGLGS